MKVNEKKLGCKNCIYRNGYVCNICWKRIYEEFYNGKEEANGKENKDKSNTDEISGN